MKAPQTRRGGRHAMAERSEDIEPAAADDEFFVLPLTMNEHWRRIIAEIPRAPLVEFALKHERSQTIRQRL